MGVDRRPPRHGAGMDDDDLDDGVEVNTFGTDPNDADSDDDGLTDGDEVNAHGTSPVIDDSDFDSLSDGAEINVHGTSPLLADTDKTVAGLYGTLGPIGFPRRSVFILDADGIEEDEVGLAVVRGVGGDVGEVGGFDAAAAAAFHLVVEEGPCVPSF